MTVSESATNYETSLVCDESAPAGARAAIREIDPAAPLIGDAMLLASELVTNAVRHSGCQPTDHITLRAAVRGSVVRLEVSDPARSASVPRLPGPDDPFGGMGLRVVEALADRWGNERGREQVVWAELSR